VHYLATVWQFLLFLVRDLKLCVLKVHENGRSFQPWYRFEAVKCEIILNNKRI
jgi:hypothetical protein